MEIEHEAGQSPAQLGPEPGEEGKTGAGDLSSRRKIEQAECGAELPVGLRSEVEFRRGAPGAKHPVGRGVAVGRSLVRKIGDRQRPLIEGGFNLAEPAIERFHLVARDLQSLHEIVGRLLGPFSAGHFVAGCVPFRFEAFDPDQHVTPLAIELEHLIQDGGQARIAAPHQAGSAPSGILTETLDVDHVSCWEGRARVP